MDAAGKDSAIESVFDGVNPQGCDVHSFKQPSTEELDHDFMWRAARRLPERGRIGIFNRSYYEEVLVVRVHPEILAKQKIPPKLVTKTIWRERFEDMSAFERYLTRNGTVMLKFFLNLSKEEQRQRFLDRLEEPAKNWKFSMGDVAERGLWDKYQAAYQDMIRHTSSRPCAVACGAGRPQVVCAGGDRIDHRQRAAATRPAVPQGRQERTERVPQGSGGTGERTPARGAGEEGRGEESRNREDHGCFITVTTPEGGWQRRERNELRALAMRAVPSTKRGLGSSADQLFALRCRAIFV